MNIAPGLNPGPASPFLNLLGTLYAGAFTWESEGTAGLDFLPPGLWHEVLAGLLIEFAQELFSFFHLPESEVSYLAVK